MVTFGYRRMQEELRVLNKEIGKIAKQSADRSQAGRRVSYCMHTPKSTIYRIQEKAALR